MGHEDKFSWQAVSTEKDSSAFPQLLLWISQRVVGDMVGDNVMENGGRQDGVSQNQVTDTSTKSTLDVKKYNCSR